VVTQIRWLGHASFQILAVGKTIYVDPRYMKSFKSEIGQYFENPDEADIILITHHHADHCYPSSFKKMLTSNTKIIAPELCDKKLGNNFRRIKAGQEIIIDKIKVKAVDAYNIKRRRASGKLWHVKGEGVGYLITIDGNTVYHAGDTEVIPEMENLGSVDVALLPIDGAFTMDIDEAIVAAKTIKPKVVIPMHNRDVDLEEFKVKCATSADIKVVPLKVGGIYHLK
jgi:L-ascorbate metabolism protein UlaG (beta-lactamase superfamily)